MAVNYNYNLDNQQRFDQVLQGYKALAGQQMSGWEAAQRGYQGMHGLVDQSVAAQYGLAKDTYRQAYGDTQQSMVSRGLGNTTILDNMQLGNNDRLAREQSLIAQGAAGQKLGVSQQALNHYAGVQQGLGQIGLSGLGFQGQQLGQKYALEANYLGQQDLAAQQQGYGVQNMGYQAGIAQNQAQLNLNNQMSMMGYQNQLARQMQDTYGFY